MPERTGHRGLLQTAVDLAQRASGYIFEHAVQCTPGRFFEHTHAAGGSIEPVHDAATGYQWHRDASSSG